MIMPHVSVPSKVPKMMVAELFMRNYRHKRWVAHLENDAFRARRRLHLSGSNPCLELDESFEALEARAELTTTHRFRQFLEKHSRPHAHFLHAISGCLSASFSTRALHESDLARSP